MQGLRSLTRVLQHTTIVASLHMRDGSELSGAALDGRCAESLS